jgi:5-methylcytosine-specific restriction endonuclease McrA
MAQTPEQKRAWYLANRELHLERSRKRHEAKRSAIRAFIAEYLSRHPCVDCGETDPIVLDFDHVGEKSFGIGSAVQRLIPLERVKAEIEKCEIRCANCHRRKTHRTHAHRTRFVGAA